MTLYIYDANGYIGDLCSNNGYKELVQQIPTQLEIITELFRDGIVAVDDNFLKEVKSLKGNEDVKNFKDLSLKCEETVIITDGVFDDGSEEEEPEEKLKSISKQERWAKFEAKTLKEETEQESYKGGEGSGNFGHVGRPGEVGGSGEGGGGSKPSSEKPKPSGGDKPSGGNGLSGSEWHNSLSDKEKGAVNAWQTHYYKDIRNAEAGISTGWADEPRFVETSKNFNAALDKDGEYEGITYRGLKNSGGRTYESLQGVDIIEWKSSASASKKVSIAENFTGSGKGILFRINGRTGVDMSSIPGWESEAEVILRKGTKYRIGEKTDKGKYIQINLTEIKK